MTVRASVLGVIASLTVAACGSSVSVDDGGTAGAGHRTLSDPDVPFTFEYPVTFREATERSAAATSALVVVGPAANSYLAVRLNGMRPLGPDQLERQARTALGPAIERSSREEHSGMPMVAMTVADTGGEALGLRSTIYGFSLAGRSWLLECHSAAADREAIAAACRQALDSVRADADASSEAPTVSVAVRGASTLAVAGRNWPARASVSILAGPPRSEAERLTTTRTDSAGGFSLDLSVPRDSGRRVVVLACRRECRVKASTTVDLPRSRP
jgi:hypothetical protein